MHKKIALFVVFAFSSLLSPFTDYEKIQYKMEGAAIISSAIVNQASIHAALKLKTLLLNRISTNYKNNHPEATDEEVENYKKSYAKWHYDFAIRLFITVLLTPIEGFLDKQLQATLLYLLSGSLNQNFENTLVTIHNVELLRDITKATDIDAELQYQLMKEWSLKEKRLNYLVQKYNRLCNKEFFVDNLQITSSYFTKKNLQEPMFVPFPSESIGIVLSHLITPYTQKRSFQYKDVEELIRSVIFAIAKFYGLDLQIQRYFKNLLDKFKQQGRMRPPRKTVNTTYSTFD